MQGPAQTAEPIIQYIYQLVDAVAQGRLLIPRLERPLVWKWDRQRELLRSVRDGIPIGAVMLWRTSQERMLWQEALAGHRLPAPQSGLPREYILDGLQRLSTLFAALRGRGTMAPIPNDEEINSIGYDLEQQAFVRMDADEVSGPVIPLDVVQDSVTLLRFQRGLQGQHVDEYVRRSDALAKAFREYKVPVISIVSEDFEVAARTFNLVNTQGAKMGEADMIHALTWSPEFEFRDRVTSLRGERLQPRGWGEVDFETILKVVKAEANLDLYEESSEQVSKILRADSGVLDRAVERLEQVAELLRTQCGIHSWELVPYSHQPVLMAEALRTRNDGDAHILLADWFWLTTYGELFASISGYRLSTALHTLRDDMLAGKLRWPGASPFRLRPLPATADFRSVRIKAMALRLARRQRDARPDGPDPFFFLAEQKRDALFSLLPRHLLGADKERYSSPANRILGMPQDVDFLRQLLIKHIEIPEWMETAYLVPATSVAAAAAGRWDSFIDFRLEALIADEKTFVEELLARHPQS